LPLGVQTLVCWYVGMVCIVHFW